VPPNPQSVTVGLARAHKITYAQFRTLRNGRFFLGGQEGKVCLKGGQNRRRQPKSGLCPTPLSFSCGVFLSPRPEQNRTERVLLPRVCAGRCPVFLKRTPKGLFLCSRGLVPWHMGRGPRPHKNQKTHPKNTLPCFFRKNILIIPPNMGGIIKIKERAFAIFSGVENGGVCRK
jgi:hypothetical protein